MDTATHSFNTAAGHLSPAEWAIIWAAIIDDRRARRRRRWWAEFVRRSARGLPPAPPWPAP